jgi:hypothetical protein
MTTCEDSDALQQGYPAPRSDPQTLARNPKKTAVLCATMGDDMAEGLECLICHSKLWQVLRK